MLQGYETFRAKYEEVFDSKGRVKACGREACKELIELCQKIRPSPGVSYGNTDTGYMNVTEIQKLALDIL